MLLLPLCLVEVLMINAINSFFFQLSNTVGMIAFSSRSVPNCVAVKVADQACRLIRNACFVIMYCLPNLCYVLSIGIFWVVCPDSKENKIKLAARNSNGNNHFKIIIINI